MNKRDLNKNEDSDSSENIEEPEEEDLEDENIEEEDDGIFDFDENFNQTGKFTVNEVTTEKKNFEVEKDINKENLDSKNHKDNFTPYRNNFDEIDFYIPESNEKKLGKDIQDKLDIYDLDIDSLPKEDLINILLRPDEPSSGKKAKKKFQLKPKNTKPNVLNSVYSNLQNMAENKDPELNEDFNVAMTKVLAKMLKESNNKNGEIFDLLISNKDKVEEELRKYDFSKKIKIEEKVKNSIDKKKKGLEVLQEKLNEDFQKVCTFAPHFQNKDKSNVKRNFDQFWEDQINHNKKIKDKVDEMKKIQVDQIKSDYQSTPKINKNSVKIFEEKQQKNDQTNTKVHERLYNKRNENVKSSALLKAYNTEVSCKSLNPTKKTEDRINILYQDALKRQNKQKEIQNRKSEEKIHKSNSVSNKYILKKFEKMFKENVEKLLKISLLGQKENHITNQPINKINLEQIIFLMHNMNFLSKEDEIDYSLTSNNCDFPLSYKNIEKKLIVDMFENLKDKDNLINLDHLFIFCLSILNLLEYYIVKSYLENNPNEQYDSNNNEPGEIPSNSNKNSLRNLNSKNNNSQAKLIKKTTSVASLYESDSNNLESLLQKLNFELKSRIVSNKKYGGLDVDGNFIITFTTSKLIFKEFNMLALNYNTLNSHSKKVEKIQQVDEENKFKPKINTNARELGNKYRQKILDQFEVMKIKDYNTVVDENFTNDLNEVSYKSRLTHTENNVNSSNDSNYINLINMKQKKKEILNQKIREERALKELENCTFKPKINNYAQKDNITPCDLNEVVPQMRLQTLHRIGTEMLINKKDKTKDDIDLERFREECTFKPNINEKEIVFESRNTLNDDKDFQKFNERLKRGRIEREIKDSMFRRGEELISPHELRKKTKSENKLKDSKARENSNSIRNSNLSPINRNFNELENGHEQKDSNKIFSKSDTKQEAVESPPRLIIDVNIRPGEKKKILVYNGDTSDQLAENFAMENNLDNLTKLRLQTLIQTQMARFLPKIIEDDRENQSMKSDI